MFHILYYLISAILYILAIPYLIYKSTQTKYKISIPARFFLKNNKPFKDEGIWFHSCSMGETKSLKPIIDKLKEENINPINISTITNTGFNVASTFTPNSRYLPFEFLLPFWIKKQKVLIVMEAELWYMMFLLAKMYNTKTILINARINDKSYNSYKKYKWFYSKIFKNIDYIFAQSKTDKDRLIQLGAKNIEVIGNIKLANLPIVSKVFIKADDRFITTLASSHENEEKLILDGYYKDMGRLIIVPRHPERFDIVDELIKKYLANKNFTYARYSKDKSFSTDIILVDSIGELVNIFAISDSVILGGAFEKIGGHNPIEPAFFNCSVITGEHIFNQKALFECVKNYQIIKNEEILDMMRDIKNIPKASLIKAGTIDKIINEIKRG